MLRFFLFSSEICIPTVGAAAAAAPWKVNANCKCSIYARKNTQHNFIQRDSKHFSAPNRAVLPFAAALSIAMPLGTLCIRLAVDSCAKLNGVFKYCSSNYNKSNACNWNGFMLLLLMLLLLHRYNLTCVWLNWICIIFKLLLKIAQHASCDSDGQWMMAKQCEAKIKYEVAKQRENTTPISKTKCGHC